MFVTIIKRWVEAKPVSVTEYVFLIKGYCNVFIETRIVRYKYYFLKTQTFVFEFCLNYAILTFIFLQPQNKKLKNYFFNWII